MFKFFFIKKHEKKVLKYISEVKTHPDRQYNLQESSFSNKTIEEKIAIYRDLFDFDKKSLFRGGYTDSGFHYSRKPGAKTTNREHEKEPDCQKKSESVATTNKSFGDINCTDKGRGRDIFDPTVVATTMNCYLNDEAPSVSLCASTNPTFVQKLIQYMRDRNLVETEVYKAALMDRRLFSKIISNRNYKPSKDTVLALIFALKLSISDAKDLLERAGYTLSHSIQRDIILEYFIKEHVYNLNNINSFLYKMKEKIIGRKY